MIRRVYYCFRLSRVSYSLYRNKLSVHNSLEIVFAYLMLLGQRAEKIGIYSPLTATQIFAADSVFRYCCLCKILFKT